MANERVTLGDVAKAAEVSRATVSRALRDSPLISKARRKSIQALARRMGYRPDPEASRLLSHLKATRTVRFQSLLGILNAHDPPKGMHTDPYTHRLLAGATRRAKALGYAVDELRLAEPGMTPARIDGILSARGIRGVLIPPEPQPLFEVNLDWSRIAAVATTTTAAPLSLHRVLPHNFHNMELLIEAALDLGYQRIGLVSWPVLESRQMFAPTSVYARYAYVAKSFTPVPVFSWDWSLGEQIYERFVRWFEKYRPDLILATGLHELNTLRERTDARCPRDFGFMSYAGTGTGISCIEQQPEAVGAAAIDVLSAHIQRGENGLPITPKTLLIEGNFVPSNTTCPQSAK